MTVTNSKESAYEAQLFVQHPPSLSYIGASKNGVVICNRHNSTTVACTLGNPLRRGDAATLMLRFDPNALEDSQPELVFRLFANSTSAELQPQPPTRLLVRVVKKVELSVHGRARPEQSFYGGVVRGESAMQFLEDIGPLVQHTYQIYNDGPWRAPWVEVYIMWPHQVANDKAQGKWLLYLEEKPTVEGANGGDCEAPADSNAFNPLGLLRRPPAVFGASSSSGGVVTAGEAPASLRMLEEATDDADIDGARLFGASMRFGRGGSRSDHDAHENNATTPSTFRGRRIRRDRSMVIKAERLVDKDGKKSDIVNMVSINMVVFLTIVSFKYNQKRCNIFATQDCDAKSAKCVRLKCKIYNMQRKTEAYIHVRSRLWNATLVSDYPRVDMVNIVSYASIKVPDTLGILQNRTDDRTFVSGAAENMNMPLC